MTKKHQDVNAHVGYRLRLRRTSLGMTQEAVARGVGVATQQVQKYETGVNVMNVNRLHEFALFLKVPVSYFFEGAVKSLAADDDDSAESHASDRESIEILKSFKRIKDQGLRKRLADLLRTLSQRDI